MLQTLDGVPATDFEQYQTGNVVPTEYQYGKGATVFWNCVTDHVLFGVTGAASVTRGGSDYALVFDRTTGLFQGQWAWGASLVDCAPIDVNVTGTGTTFQLPTSLMLLTNGTDSFAGHMHGQFGTSDYKDSFTGSFVFYDLHVQGHPVLPHAQSVDCHFTKIEAFVAAATGTASFHPRVRCQYYYVNGTSSVQTIEDDTQETTTRPRRFTFGIDRFSRFITPLFQIDNLTAADADYASSSLAFLGYEVEFYPVGAEVANK